VIGFVSPPPRPPPVRPVYRFAYPTIRTLLIIFLSNVISYERATAAKISRIFFFYYFFFFFSSLLPSTVRTVRAHVYTSMLKPESISLSLSLSRSLLAVHTCVRNVIIMEKNIRSRIENSSRYTLLLLLLLLLLKRSPSLPFSVIPTRAQWCTHTHTHTHTCIIRA
jgi:hypothetical protein